MRWPVRVGCVVAVATLAAGAPSWAFEPRIGTFVAGRGCVATARIGDEAGFTLEPGARYRLLGANRARATHYRIRLPADGGDRWVAAGCGRKLPGDGAGGDGESGGTRREYVLAVSWQPAFCEGHADAPECASQTADRFDATHFALHGLWPQPRSLEYCGVPARERALDRPPSWDRLPAVALTDATRAALAVAMPGARSSLERHEWLKHGTCYGADPEEYFHDALLLLGQLNDSAVRGLLAGRIGSRVTADQLAAAFDASFGAGAGRRVTMACDRQDGRVLVVELRLSLAGEITPASRLGELLAAAPEAPQECTAGAVDAVGGG